MGGAIVTFAAVAMLIIVMELVSLLVVFVSEDELEKFCSPLFNRRGSSSREIVTSASVITKGAHSAEEQKLSIRKWGAHFLLSNACSVPKAAANATLELPYFGLSVNFPSLCLHYYWLAKR